MLPPWDDEVVSRLSGDGPRASDPLLAELLAACRLLGNDRSLVLGGGGNASVKGDFPRPWSPGPGGTLWIKASGRDMATLAAGDLVPLDLARVRSLLDLPGLGSDDLPAALATCRLDPEAAAPSVESLVHALAPGRAVLHVHPEPLLVLAAQPGGRELLAGVLGERFAVLDYAMPGLPLARAAREAIETGGRNIHGIAFRHHGLFAWGATPREAYERLRSALAASEDALAERLAASAPREPEIEVRSAPGRAALLAPLLRGVLALPSGDPDRPWQRFLLSLADDEELLAALDRPGAEELAARGVLTPDHLVHTRNRPLVFRDDPAADPETTRGRLAEAVAAWGREYAAYLARHGENPERVDHRPRLVLVPGLGLYAAGETPRRVAAAREIGRRSVLARDAAEAIGRFEPLPEEEVHRMEFWSGERAKLERERRGLLGGRVALVTGAAGAIGAGIAEALARAGALVFLADRPGEQDRERLERALARVRRVAGGDAAHPLPFDVTDPAATDAAMDEACRLAGGVDLLVLSHGMAEVGDIADLDPDRLRTVFGVNALGSFHVLGAFVRRVRLEGCGGDVVLVSTKNVPDPGASFGAYSASKAAAHQLARVAALELAPLDVRVNLVSPDAVFGDDEIPSLLWQEVGAKRARSRGIDPAELPERYRQRNLLKARVTTAHVAEAVRFFAERRVPCTGAVLPVDGGLPGAFPR